MKPCARRVPKIGKKNTRELYVQNFDNQVKTVVGAHMKESKTSGKQQLENLN
jgi:hypothetical protein